MYYVLCTHLGEYLQETHEIEVNRDVTNKI